jgi:hypothetical protein
LQDLRSIEVLWVLEHQEEVNVTDSDAEQFGEATL